MPLAVLLENFDTRSGTMRSAAKKQGTGRLLRKDRAAAKSPVSDVENAMIAHTPPPSIKNSKSHKKGALVKAVPSHKITEFFPVRRSERKTQKKIDEEGLEALREQVYNPKHEKLLEVYKDSVKGRGIRTVCNFDKGQFVVEYRGVMMEYAKAKLIEAEYSHDEDIGSYMFFFEHKGKKWCIDATAESPWKGRLINHSVLRPNLNPRVVEFSGVPHLIFCANRPIAQGEELLYDYGDRSAETRAKNPWLMNT